jgi:hypothetical protein
LPLHFFLCFSLCCLLFVCFFFFLEHHNFVNVLT